MKRYILLMLVSLFAIQMFASELVLIPTKSYEDSKNLFSNPALTINFYRDEFVIATLNGLPKHDIVILDSNPWESGMSYYVVYLDNNTDKLDYYNAINSVADVLWDGGNILIIRIDEVAYGQLPPAKNDGLVRIFNNRVVLPRKMFYNTSGRFDPDPFIVSLLNQVTGTNITATVQHLEDYTTRNCYKPQSIEAQNWLKEQYENLGLSVEIMDFPMPGGAASDNVIATKLGTKYPDEFVVLGGHYDSISFSGAEPGADDNASGSAGVLEIARILSEYEFDRSIIFCAFSGEEYGLYGSAAYASRCAQQGMDILGYFNMDMVGYLKPGNTTIMTSLIYPQSALELANFYTSVTATYLPDFVVIPATFSGGDSDHTSFNQNGYMGIFPFEDVDNMSPYIHTSNDLVGPSYNNENQAVVFTKAILASVATMANMKFPPRNLVGIPGDNKVELIWDELLEIDEYRVYRDGSYIASSLTNGYIDLTVENGTLYQYYVTAIYSDTGEESIPSNVVNVTPMPPIGLPLIIDFENGAPYWEFEGSWGITSTTSYSPSHSITESPSGNYANNIEIIAKLSPFNLNLGYTSASLSFWTKYNIEQNWDFMYLEISTNGTNWTSLATFTGVQNTWIEKSYSLNNYLNKSNVFIRFRFKSDIMVNKDGMYIDDFKIDVTGGYTTQLMQIPQGWSGISSYLSPAQTQVNDLLEPLGSNLIILQDMTNVYWPEQNINTIGNWNTHNGYKIKLSNNATLQFLGSLEENKTLSLPQGWSLIPVISDCQVSCEELFGSYNQVFLVKDVAATDVFWPAQNIQTLEKLIPGKAYYIYNSSPLTITFPSCSKTQSITLENQKVIKTQWEMVAPTGNSHVISVPASAIQDFAVGDQIGVFTPADLCAGCLQIDDLTTNKALVVFANDSLTSAIDGFVNNEPFKFKLFKNSSGKEYNLIATFDNSLPDYNVFVDEGISGLTKLIIDNTGIDMPKNITGVYPNPSKGNVVVKIKNGSNAILRILNLSGQCVLMQNIDKEAVINTSSLTKGVYTFQFEGIDFNETQKVVIQ